MDRILVDDMQFFSKIIKSDFFKNLSIITLGTAFSQIITIACTPIISRIYSAEAFGLLGVFMALVSIISCASTGGYNLAIMLPKENNDAARLLVLACIFSVFVGLVVFAALAFGPQICAILGAPALCSYIIWLPFTVIMSGWFQGLGDWAGRHKKFKLIAAAMIAGSLVTNGWKVGAGWMEPTANALIVSTFLMFLVQAAVLLKEGAQPLRYILKAGIDQKEIFFLADRYRQLPLFRVPKNLIYAVAQNAPALMLSAFFTADKTGYFLLVDRILCAPGVLVGEAIRRVYYQQAAESYRAGKSLLGSLSRLTVGLSAAGIVPFLLVIFFGPDLFELAFGVQWRPAGEYSRWIAISTFFIFINTPSVVVIPILKLERFLLAYEVVGLVSRVLSLFVGYFFFKSDTVAIALFSLVGAALNVFLIFYVIHKAKNSNYSLA